MTINAIAMIPRMIKAIVEETNALAARARAIGAKNSVKIARPIPMQHSPQ